MDAVLFTLGLGDVDAVTLGCGKCGCSCLHWDVGDVDAVLFTLGCGRFLQCCLHWDVDIIP